MRCIVRDGRVDNNIVHEHSNIYRTVANHVQWSLFTKYCTVILSLVDRVGMYLVLVLLQSFKAYRPLQYVTPYTSA